MRIFWFVLAWATGVFILCIAGIHVYAAMPHGRMIIPPGWSKILIWAEFGAELYLNLFVLAFCFDAVPRHRAKPRTPQKFGLWQGIWGMAAFGITMTAGGVLLVNILSLENLILAASHSLLRVSSSGHDYILGTVCAGELVAALWVVWYMRRLGPAWQADGSASGLAWRAAPAQAYLTATACALAILFLVMALYHFIPPDVSRLQDLPMEKLFEGSTLSMLPLMIVAMLLAPALEEIVFRGFAFGGLAARLGPVWAGIITTLVFMAAHAPEKIHYLPGFIDVGLMAGAAVLLRLKFRSIKPGILLHIVYNIGSVLTASWMS
jgi:membrane protease YdiL (CAAX protease family)